MTPYIIQSKLQTTENAIATEQSPLTDIPRSALTPMKKWIRGKITAKRQWADNLYSLYLDAPIADFSAGQFLQIAMDIDGERVARSYSLVNAPEERPLEVYFNEVPEGPLTPRLSKLNPGEQVWVSEKASGVFIADRVPDCQNLWMFATGTALGVYLSILKTDAPWRRFENIMLIHGCRVASELNYSELINELLQRHEGRFQFASTLSREPSSRALQGRITKLLENGTLEKQIGRVIAPEDSHVMLCGNEAMIGDMRNLLEARGMKRHTARQQGHYTTEKYH